MTNRWSCIKKKSFLDRTKQEIQVRMKSMSAGQYNNDRIGKNH